MSYRILLGIDEPGIAAEASAILEETGEAEVVERVRSSGEVSSALRDTPVDVALLHEDLGPLPVLDLARQLAGRFPEVAVVLVVRNQSPEILRAALRAGVRGVVGLPFALEEVHAALQGAGSWSRIVRDHVMREPGDDTATPGGAMVTLVGAKGGVGTTTLCVYLALMAARQSTESSVCLVDLDLQAGDVRGLLDLTYGRGLSDLIDVAEEVSGRQLEDSLYLHASRLRVLLPPERGEEAEDVGTRAARQILGAIRTHFDIVIVDAGTLVTDATAVATEMADQTILVTTPDVLALRATSRMLDLWARLQVRKDGIAVLVNRMSKDAEVQPELIRRVVQAPLVRTMIPSAYRELEAPSNTGVPERLEDGPLRRALAGLGQELGLLPSGGGQGRRRRLSRQSGHVAVEALGMAPLVAVIVLLLFQLVLAGLTFVFAGHAAQEGAHALSLGAAVEQAARADLPEAWRDGMTVRIGADEVEVTLSVPSLAPGFDTPLRVPVQAGAVLESALRGRG